MRVLLTETARRHFGGAVTGVSLQIELVAMGPQGTLTLANTTPVDWADAAIDVAWATADLFGQGAPIRPFFGFVRRSQSLRWLQSPAAGVDDPLFADLVSRGVRVSNAHVNSIPIAEFVLRAALDAFQRADLWREAQNERAWKRHDFRELWQSTWLVIGVGSIGSEVSRRAQAFGAHVIGVRRNPSGDEPVDEMVSPSEVIGILPMVDVIVVSAPATPATTKLVNRTFLAAMKPGSVLINVARGSLVDETALVEALDRGVPGFAVLDVFESEPLPSDHALWSHPKVAVTAHNAAGGTSRYGRAAELFVDNLGRYLSGEPLHNEVTAADLPT